MKTGFCAKGFASIGKFLSEMIEKTKHEDISFAEALDVWKILNLVKENRIKDTRCAEMLKLWYENVLDLLKKEKRGHFIETLPTDLDFFRFWPWEALEGIKESLDMLTEREKQRKIQYRTDLSFENVSFTDVYLPDDRNEMVLYRCGLCDLLSDKSSSDDDPAFRTFDAREIINLTQKEDITEDEADWIYDYVVMSESVQELAGFDSSPLDEWFKSVQRKLESGRYGNFITTVPIDHERYHLRFVTKLLPREDLYFKAFVFKNGKVTKIEEARAGMLKKHLPKLETVSRCVHDPCVKSEKEREEFFKRRVKSDSDAIKLEALRILGFPFVEVGYYDVNLETVLYDVMTDDAVVKKILTNNENGREIHAQEALEKTIEKIVEEKIKGKLEADTDDSWADVIR